MGWEGCLEGVDYFMLSGFSTAFAACWEGHVQGSGARKGGVKLGANR